MPFRRSLICLLAVCVCVSSLAKEPGVAIRWDPESPNKEIGAVWLTYLLARTSYRLEHKLPVPKSGEIIPSFEEEVFARDTAAQVYAELGKKNLRDRYWNDVMAVKAKGFMREYVWTYFRRTTWPEKQRPGNLSAFHSWKEKNLSNHQPQTRGGLGVEK